MRFFAFSGFHRLLAAWVCLLLSGCVDPYAPDVISSSQRYLVVDGFINSKGITTINLSRTYPVDAKTPPPAERNAAAYIEEEGGPRFPLRESTPGVYTSASLLLNDAKKYRLHLNTQDGKEYASAYVSVKNTQPIDDVEWQTSGQNVGIYVSTHDEARASQYYRWEYTETWEIIPVYRPEVEYKGRIQPIQVPYPTLCWGSAPSSDIKTSRTTDLSQDVVSRYPLRTLPLNSERLYSKYSLLVTQHALTREEYDYWELLKKNTENIGTLFDPLPSQLTGNVQCLSDNSEIALGYVGAHSVAEKRIFISNDELPADSRQLNGYEACYPPDTTLLKDVDNDYRTGVLIPIETLRSRGGTIVGYTKSVIDCIDCRKRGTAVRPSFWQ